MRNLTAWYRQSPISDLLIGGGLACGFLMAILYFTPREEFAQLVFLWMALFLLYGWWILSGKNTSNSESRLIGIVGVGVVLRLLATFAIPVLSNDYFRFVWDGQLWISGVNPFTILPSELAAESGRLLELGLSQEWFDSLNSPNYFTIYPPVLQGIFLLAAWTGNITTGVFLMKGIVFIAELFSIWLLIRILRHLGKPLTHTGWYILNPLVIIELSGSLHFEALMITFMLASIWMLMKHKEVLSAAFLGLSVATKLLPLMFLPFLIREIGFWRSVKYGLITIGVVLILFLPMLSQEMLEGFRESLTLYVNRFEFNAGIWYLIRYIGSSITGWNPIREVGPLLSPIAGALILAIAFLRKPTRPVSWAEGMLFALTIYFFLSLIVHPWYITGLLILAPITGRTYPLVWSLFLPWTYLAYSFDPVSESMILIGVEYIVVFLWIIFENKAFFQRVIPAPLRAD